MAAERNNDDIAAALHGLHTGEQGHAEGHVDSTHGQVVPQSPVVPPAPAQQAPRGSAKPQAAAPVKRPPAPVARPAVPPAPAVPTAPAYPSLPSRPAPGRARPATPVRAAAPLQPDQVEHVESAETYDSVKEATPGKPPVKTPRSRTLGFRRTVIPVLLTTGLMMIVMGAARWFIDEEAPLARMPVWVVGVLLGAGAVFVALGVANILFVHAEMNRSAAESA